MRIVPTTLAVLRTMRPRQWTKNLIVLAPLIFGGRLADGHAVLTSLGAFAVFCAVSGSTYLANDLSDRRADREHERKRSRPIASGELPVRTAVAVVCVLGPSAVGASYLLGFEFGLVVSAYAVLQVAYTRWLKREVILDVMTISAGFVLRVLAGAIVIGTTGSPWLYACAALLALFLGFGKRRHELVTLGHSAESHRGTLGEYTPQFLDAVLSAVTASTIVTYALYTFFSPTAGAHQYLMLTVPFVAYGMFRYLHLIYKENLGGNPEEILLTDIPMIVNIALWLVSAAIVVYVT